MPPARDRMGVQVCLDQGRSFQRLAGTWSVGQGWTCGHPRTSGCSVRASSKGWWCVGSHLDDERVLKHGIPHDPQPLVLHARPDVSHGQGPPRGRADLADRAVHRLLPSHEVVAGALGLWHPGGRRESTRGLSPARFPAWGPRAQLLGAHRLDPTTWTPGWAPAAGLPQERGAPTSAAASFQGDLTVRISPSGSSGHLLGALLRIGKGGKVKTTP